MAFISKQTDDHCVMHMESPKKSEILVEVHMSREVARRLMDTELPDRGDDSVTNVGEAILNRLAV